MDPFCRLLLFFVLASLAGTTAVHSATLIPTESLWRWRPGLSEASTPTSAWREPDFQDAEFVTAPAPFWYGDVLSGGTRIEGMQNNYRCVFLRCPFLIEDPSVISSLQMTALVDDGFVAWINGHEVLRVNMPNPPGSNVTIEHLAQNASEPVALTPYALPAAVPFLRQGTNVLAVQVFQSSLGSSDLGFEASLDATFREPDRTPPQVAGVSPTPGGTVRTLDSVTVLFSEPVTGVDADALRINGQPSTSVIPVGASQYLFTFPNPNPGPVEMAWNVQAVILDLASPPNAFAGGSWSYTLDPNAPDSPPYISEFMASNTRTLPDENGAFPDWIEIYNPSATPVNLDGWYLTDSPDNLTRWRFPSTPINGGAFLLVFASGENRRTPGQPLHTSFQLAAGGEYLALVHPDGRTIASEFAPAFPQQVPDVSHGILQLEHGDTLEAGASGVYFTVPTPGTANLGGSILPGPIIADVQHTPHLPGDEEDLRITARVSPSLLPVANVQLRYRIQFATPTTVPMHDDGAHGDGLPGDGVFGAWIPAHLSTNGQMIRYAILAADTAGQSSRWPLFTQPTATPEYLGTVVHPSYVTSRLPVFHLFVAPNQMAGIDSESGGRASFFYDGEFYDNIYVELRGNTSASLNKKSHRLEFNRGHALRHAGPGGRTRRSSLLAEHLDPTYLRQHLCFWLLGNIGVPAPYHYPVRVQLNGQFYQLAFHNDVIGQEQVERMGYDPRGALYKAVGNLTPNFSSTGVFQKLEPKDDPSRTDYLQLANGIHESASLAVRRRTVFDLLDLPQVINHLAGTRWCAENDDVWANMSLYRDTHGDGLWRNIPFDMNASWGQLYGGSNPLEATLDHSKSHPLYGGSSTEGNFNRLYDVIVTLPETRQMLLRRQRSILDQWVQPPDTPPADRLLEGYIRHMTNLIALEASLDRAQWGFSPWAPGKTFAAGVGDLFQQFITPRRRHWYVTHSITNTSRPIGITSSHNAGIPLAQPDDVRLTFVGLDFNPVSGLQSQEYIALSNASPIAVDLTGWQLDGGVRFTFQPGTVIPSQSVLYVSPDVRQFRARTSGPRGGQGLFVVGPYAGQLSARGESLILKNASNRTLETFTYPGAPSPAQQALRITEIMYHPADTEGTAADDFEFLELRNVSTTTSLDLTGVRLVNGVTFQFTNGPLSQLTPGAYVLLVANASAFTSRYGNDLPVAGEYTGRLNNGGERLVLLDAQNEEILDFSYNDTWHPATDGQGHSLVAINELAAPDTWNNRAQWKPSALHHGSPGRSETIVPPAEGAPVLVHQPLGQSALPGGPLTLSLEVTNTTELPLCLWLWRGSNTTDLSPADFYTVEDHRFFLTLTGTLASPPWSRFAFVITNRIVPTGITSAVAQITYLTDTNHNGIADDWELTHFQNEPFDPLDDADADGQSNHAEYLSGTLPRDPLSRLQLDLEQQHSVRRLQFQARPHLTYTIQTSDTLEPPSWVRFEDVVAAPNHRLIDIPIPEPNPSRFFRVVTPRQP